jgi:hypothetical protein
MHSHAERGNEERRPAGERGNCPVKRLVRFQGLAGNRMIQKGFLLSPVKNAM